MSIMHKNILIISVESHKEDDSEILLLWGIESSVIVMVVIKNG